MCERPRVRMPIMTSTTLAQSICFLDSDEEFFMWFGCLLFYKEFDKSVGCRVNENAACGVFGLDSAMDTNA